MCIFLSQAGGDRQVNNQGGKFTVDNVPLYSVSDELSAGTSEEPMTRKRNVTKSIVKMLSSGLIVSINCKLFTNHSNR